MTTTTKKRGVDPAQLIPSADRIQKAHKEQATATYHVGIIPGLYGDGTRASRPIETYEDGGETKTRVKQGCRKCPQHAENFGPVTFAETYTPNADRNAAGEQVREHHFGRLVTLTRSEVERCAGNIGRAVVRWRARDGKHAHGHKVLIPTDQDMKNYTDRGRMSPYTPHENDEPYANWLYMVKRDSYSPEIPEPVSVTGIEFPD